MNEPDEWCMKQVALGNQRYVEPLIRRYSSAMLTFIGRIAGRLHRDEEIFQEVFLAMWLGRATYQYPAMFRPWLYAIALNKCRQTLRRFAPVFSALPEPDLADEGAFAGRQAATAPVEAAIAAETAILVEIALGKLAPRQREVIVMRLWNGLSYAEIAEATGVREGTVRSQMHEALAAIRRDLEPRLRA